MNNVNISKDDLLIFDAHCDTANVVYDDSSYFIDTKNRHLDFNKIKKGGLKAQIFAIYVNPVYAPDRCMNRALSLYDSLEKHYFKSGFGKKVTSTSEMNSAIKNDKLACWLSLESGDIIENSTKNLEFFYHKGFRVMTLTHTKNTDWADSSSDVPKWDGLNQLGRKIVTKMDQLKMAIDVSHVSDKTVEDVFEVTKMPIMASHSSARALCDIPRNIPDNLIKEIAERNGFIGVNFYPGFLKKSIYDQMMNNIKKYDEWFKKEIKGNETNPDILNQTEMKLLPKITKGNDRVDLNILINHIKHIADIGGIDCVGLGSDFDGIPSTPTDLTDVSCYPAFADGLLDQGFKEKEISKIMGLNLLNFLKRMEE